MAFGVDNGRPSGAAAEDAGDARTGRSVALVFAALALAHAATLHAAGPVDDDYIVWRYARNWVEQGTYAFNPGEGPSDGVTTPLWFLLCSAAVVLGIPPEWFTPLVGALAFGGLAYTVARIGQCHSRALGGAGLALLPAALVALHPAVAWHAISGLGTVPAALAVAVGVHASLGATGVHASLRKGRRVGVAAGLAFAVATAFRPECIVVALGMTTAAGGVRPAALTLAPSVVVTLAIAYARWQAFGTAVPATAAVKALPLATELEYGAAYVFRSAREGGLGLLLIVASLTALARDRAFAGIGRAALLGALAVLAVGGDWMVYGRFWVPFVSLASLGAVAWLATLARPLRVVGGALACALVLFGFGARRDALLEYDAFERWWLCVGDAFAEQAEGRPSVALSPIGAFGWRSDLPIVDVLGLTHTAFLGRAPDLATVRAKGHHRFDGDWVLDQEPDYMVLGNGVVQPATGRVAINPWEADIVRDPRFEIEYERATVVLDGPDGAPRTLPYALRRGRPALRPVR